MHTSSKDNDVVDYKEKVIIVVFSCVAFNILLLITIAIIYRRRMFFLAMSVLLKMINLNLENEGIDEEVDVFNTVLPR